MITGHGWEKANRHKVNFTCLLFFYTFVRYALQVPFRTSHILFRIIFFSFFSLFWAFFSLTSHTLVLILLFSVVLSPSFPFPSHFQLNCTCPECHAFMKHSIRVQRATTKIQKVKDERLHARVHEVEVDLVSFNCLREPQGGSNTFCPCVFSRGAWD